MFNSKLQGNIGLGAAIAYFTRLGKIVLLPLNDSQTYDLVIDDNGRLSRVQVKTTNSKSVNQKHCLVKIDSRGGTDLRDKPFNPHSCDLLFIFAMDGTMWLIATNHIKQKHAITLDERYNCFKIR